MAGHAQGRAQPYSHRPSQASQSRQQADSKNSSQGTTSHHTNSASNASSTSPKPRLRTSCDRCQEAKLGCSQEKPTCRRCSRHGIPCVYSPFRRIGRPRKSTNPRTTNASNNTKSRSKIDDVDKVVKIEPIENLPELETDGRRGSLFSESIPAPPSSPASTENSNGAWYPWTADGNSLHTGLQMNFDNPGSLIDAIDPFSTTTDYLDLDLYFDNHHKSLMDCTMSEGDGPTLGLGSSMQPTPPSSATAEMMVFGETMLKDSDTHGMSTLLSQHPQHDHSSSHSSTGSISSGGKLTRLNLGTISSDCSNSSAFQSNDLTIQPPSQLPNGLRQNSQMFVPTPELTPPPIDQSPQPFSPCNQRCSSSLIQRLATLNQVLSDSKSPPLDLVLQTEKDTYSLCRKIINCNPCMGNRSSFLLFSMVVEQVMRLLETVPDEGASDSCTLSVGSFEIDDDTKSTFLKRYLLSRLGQVRSMLKEFKQTIDTDADDYNSNVAKDMASDVYSRLDVLKGAIERWK